MLEMCGWSEYVLMYCHMCKHAFSMLASTHMSNVTCLCFWGKEIFQACVYLYTNLKWLMVISSINGISQLAQKSTKVKGRGAIIFPKANELQYPGGESTHTYTHSMWIDSQLIHILITATCTKTYIKTHIYTNQFFIFKAKTVSWSLYLLIQMELSWWWEKAGVLLHQQNNHDHSRKTGGSWGGCATILEWKMWRKII